MAQVLNELGLKNVKTIWMEFGAGPGAMKSPEYLAINPNGRIPALIDHSNNDFIVWESNAIILYLCKKYDPEGKTGLWSAKVEEQGQIETWLFFQASGQGPMIGQGIWFKHYHSERPIESAITRYREETRRVLGVVTTQLEKEGSGGWLVLGRMTVADISFLQWFLNVKRIDIDIEKEFPSVWSWMERMKASEGIREWVEKAIVPAGGTN